ncbi:MAG: ribosome biogenesis GTPase YlqF [Clostridia bacterium]|nr:ribosome biogenesis GTPase YlqF [Clostridia bacterium]
MQSNIIQWFPGHMAKTKRLIRENISSVDIIIEVLDARIPYSSKNPEIDELVCQKPIITILNKSTLADPSVSRKWKSYYEARKRHCVICDCQTGEGIGELKSTVAAVMKEKIDAWKARGIIGKNVRAMIVGIPNVGKSSFINRLAGTKKAKVENRPGVTLSKHWVPTSIGLDLLDMPGVLWPKFENPTVGQNLAITGAIKDDVLQIEEIAMIMCERLRDIAPEMLSSRYNLGDKSEFCMLDGYDLFELIGRKRHLLQSGGEVNHKRCADMLLDEFRAAKIGRITLETPQSSDGE